MSFSVIQIKYSLVTSAPQTLAQGELAYSQLSGKLFIGNDAGLPVEIGGASLISRVGSIETTIGLIQSQLGTHSATLTSIQQAIDALNASQDSELAAAVASLQTALASEANSRAAADEALDDKIDAERNRAIASEAAIAASVAALQLGNNNSIGSLGDRVQTIETDMATLQDNDLQISGEISSMENRVIALESQLAGSGDATFNDVTITGNLVVQGEVTQVNSSVVNVDDPVIKLATNTQALADGTDRGIEYKWFDTVTGTVKTGFFGIDATDGKFKFIPDATSGGANVFVGALGNVQFGKIEASGIDVGQQGVHVSSGGSIDVGTQHSHVKITETGIEMAGANRSIVGNGSAQLVGFIINGGNF